MDTKDIFEAMLKDRRVRLNIVKRSHKFFFYFYFAHYAEFAIAPFHEEMFYITEDTAIRSVVIVAFRGSAKSTIFSLSFPLWSILAEQKIKYVVILSQTQQKAQTLLQQIKYELETNELLKKDLGPFKEERDQWNIVSLHLSRYNAKITAASAEQSIRGMRHIQHRPQLIVADDLEDMESVKTMEGRNKTYNWLVGDVIPAGGRNTRLIIVGSLLHEDSLIKRLEKNIKEGKMAGVYREYPLLDENGNSTWPGKFPDKKSIELERAKGITDAAWYREYLLQIVHNEDQLIRQEWIKEYEVMPNLSGKDYVGTFIGIDPAGSDNAGSDCTAMVAASVFGQGEELKIYIHPNPINKRLRFHETKETAIMFANTLSGNFPVRIFVEDVGIQKWLIQELLRNGLNVEEFKVGGVDKQSRLSAAAGPVQAGMVFFPKEGCGELRQQLVNFGLEKYDDLADAFAIVILKIKENCRIGKIIFLKVDGSDYRSPSSASPDTPTPVKNNNPDPKSGLLPEKITTPWKTEEERKKMECDLDIETHRKQIEDAGGLGSIGERLGPTGPFWFAG